MDKLNELVLVAANDLMDGVVRTVDGVLSGIKALIEKAEWDADFRQVLLDHIDDLEAGGAQ